MRLFGITAGAAATLLTLAQVQAQERLAAPSYTLLHRYVDVEGSATSWTERARVRIVSASASTSADAVEASVQHSGSAAAELVKDKEVGWYQVMLKAPQHKSDAQGWIASARACSLPAPLTLTLHLPPPSVSEADQAMSVRGLSLFATGADAADLDERGCPKQKKGVAEGAEELQVKVVRAVGTGSPPPRVPILKPDGTKLKEGEVLPKEKSFVQKYWYYLVPIVLLMAIPTELADSGDKDDGEEGADDGPPRVIGGGGAAAARASQAPRRR